MRQEDRTKVMERREGEGEEGRRRGHAEAEVVTETGWRF